MVWKTPPAARQKSIPTPELGVFSFPKSCMLIRLKGSSAGKLFLPGLRLILHKPVFSDAQTATWTRFTVDGAVLMRVLGDPV